MSGTAEKVQGVYSSSSSKVDETGKGTFTASAGKIPA